MTSLAFLLSGSGTTLENLIESLKKGVIKDTKIGVVISSRKGVRGLTIAKDNGIPHYVVESKQFKQDWKAFNEAVYKVLDQFNPDFIVLGGFLSLFHVDPVYHNKVLNIHPALIPSFCGKGFYGHHVHKAVLEKGVKVTGCTVHFVDNVYDHGPILAQEVVPINKDDNLVSIGEKVLNAERMLYPKVIKALVEGRITGDSKNGYWIENEYE